MKSHTELDFLGEVYASTINKNHLGTFNIAAHLKESVDPKILQQAVNDLTTHLPFLKSRLQPNFSLEILTEPSKIVLETAPFTFTDYYNKDKGHMLRVLYGAKHIRIEASHTLTDGRGLAKITSALLVRYFELMDVEINKDNIIDYKDNFQPEVIEDAYERFATRSEKPANKKKEPKLKKAYKHDHKQQIPTHIASKTFDLDKIKHSAKENNTTISEYILAHIFIAIAEERNESNNEKAIVAEIPIDFRHFFPSKTIRNFVGGKKIVMPETSDFDNMIQQIRHQFASITADFVQDSINELHIAKNTLQRFPKKIKKFLIKTVSRQANKSSTTMFSNLGLLKLPKAIEERLEKLEFLISPTEGLPYTFSCITINNVLTFSITADVESDETINKVMRRLEESN